MTTNHRATDSLSLNASDAPAFIRGSWYKDPEPSSGKAIGGCCETRSSLAVDWSQVGRHHQNEVKTLRQYW